MSRFVIRVAVVAMAFGMLFGGVVVAQTPVLVPETPPALPGATEPSSHDHVHDHGGGRTRLEPADRPPTLIPAYPRRDLGPHGGSLAPQPGGRWQVELLYDEANHALTIYLPPSMHVSAAPQSHEHNHASNLAAAAFPLAPYSSSNDPYACPLGREAIGAHDCPQYSTGRHPAPGGCSCEGAHRYGGARRFPSLHPVRGH